MNKIVCRCGKGYASPFDNLCRFCREDQHCQTRRDCTRFGIKRGEGLTLDQLLGERKGVAEKAPLFNYKPKQFSLIEDLPMPDNVLELPVEKTFKQEQALYELLVKTIREFDGEISLVAALGVLELVKKSLIDNNRS